MKKFQYQEVANVDSKEFDKELNDLGINGWRVIGYQVIMGNVAAVSRALLEREIPEPKPHG